MVKITLLGGHIFKQLFAADFEEHGGGLRLKHDADIDRNAIGFVILRDSAEEKKKLKKAFGAALAAALGFKAPDSDLAWVA